MGKCSLERETFLLPCRVFGCTNPATYRIGNPEGTPNGVYQVCDECLEGIIDSIPDKFLEVEEFEEVEEEVEEEKEVIELSPIPEDIEMTSNAALKYLLTERGIEFNERDNKATLVKLLEGVE